MLSLAAQGQAATARGPCMLVLQVAAILRSAPAAAGRLGEAGTGERAGLPDLARRQAGSAAHGQKLVMWPVQHPGLHSRLWTVVPSSAGCSRCRQERCQVLWTCSPCALCALTCCHQPVTGMLDFVQPSGTPRPGLVAAEAPHPHRGPSMLGAICSKHVMLTHVLEELTRCFPDGWAKLSAIVVLLQLGHAQ